MNGEIIEANDLIWSDILKNNSHIVIMFYSPACPHCREMDPYFLEYAKQFQGITAFVRLNVTRNLTITKRYGVMATPTFKFLCNGQSVQELVGVLYPSVLKQAIIDLQNYGLSCLKKSTVFDTTITGYA